MISEIPILFLRFSDWSFTFEKVFGATIVWFEFFAYLTNTQDQHDRLELVFGVDAELGNRGRQIQIFNWKGSVALASIIVPCVESDRRYLWKWSGLDGT